MEWRWSFATGTPVAGFSEEAVKRDERVKRSEMEGEMSEKYEPYEAFYLG